MTRNVFNRCAKVVRLSRASVITHAITGERLSVAPDTADAITALAGEAFTEQEFGELETGLRRTLAWAREATAATPVRGW